MIENDENDINSLSEEQKIELVKRDPFKISSINKPSIPVQIATLTSKPDTLNTSFRNMGMDYSKEAIIACKDVIIKAMLEDFTKRHIHEFKSKCEVLWYGHDLRWPEVDVIVDSMRKDRLLEGSYNNLSEKQILNIVTKNPLDIKFISNPSEKVQLAAIKSGYESSPSTMLSVISSIKKPTDLVQTLVFKLHINAFLHIKPRVLSKVALEKNKVILVKYIKELIEEDGFIIAAAVINKAYNAGIRFPELSGSYIDSFKDYCIVDILKIMKSNFFNDASKMVIALDKLKVKWPEMEILKQSLRADGIIKEPMNINDLSEEEQIRKVTKHPRQIHDIKDPSEAVQLAAVKSNAHYIVSIKNPTEAVQFVAFKTDTRNIFEMLMRQNRPSKVTLEYFKSDIIKTLLMVFEKNNYVTADNLVKMLVDIGLDWPELETLQKSIDVEMDK